MFHKLYYSIILGVNGSGTNGGEEGGENPPLSPKDQEEKDRQELIKHNNEIYNKITKRLGKEKKEKLKEILDYCNSEGLKILDTVDNPLYDSRINGKVARMSIWDPEAAQIYNFRDDVLVGDNSFTKSELKTALDRTRTLFNEIRNDVRPDVSMNVNSINFIGARTLGRYNWGEQSIQLAPYAFRPYYQWFTGLKGTIIHEMIHNWEYNNYGKTGGYKKFSELSEYPTIYSNGGEYKGRYFERNPVECITTVCEQVYTGRLREDAILKDGTTPASYEEWAEEWKDLVEEAKRIMNIRPETY